MFWNRRRRVARGEDGGIVSVVIASSKSGRVLQWRLSEATLRAAAIAVAVLLLATLGGLVTFGRLAAQARMSKRLDAENDSLRIRVARLDDLEKKFGELELTNRKMRVLAGLDAYGSDGAEPKERVGDDIGSRSENIAGGPVLSVPRLAPHLGPISRSFMAAGSADGQHPGVDVSGSTGEPILAAGGGLVVVSGTDSVYGNRIVIDHGDGLKTIYGHASKLLVSVGDSVRQGQKIALLGSTGRSSAPHLHFEVLEGNLPVAPGRYITEYRHK
jgi:murein DD-endopeptidase MepM/ murein hydrolase activator NlpD